ncbi:hypothetical protein AB0H94_05395 [Streptomyces purpurascens]|uniref:hypothetical protein n=1 Tax=Streptomyces purpurascens TaxID=1924 RepID=UPI0033F7BFF0
MTRTPVELLQLLDAVANDLRAIATGTSSAQAPERYQDNREELDEGLAAHGIPSPFPWKDLAQWRGAYPSISKTYEGRREHIEARAAPVRKQLERLAAGAGPSDSGPASPDWPELASRITELRQELTSSPTLDVYQDVGRRAREILIELGQLVYRPEMLPVGAETPQEANAKARLDYAATALMGGSGSVRKDWRRLINAAWDLQQSLTHSGSADFISAFAAVQATMLLVWCFEQAVRKCD